MYRLFKYMYVYFLKISSRIQEKEKLRSWTYLLENNHVWQVIKLMISSMSRTQGRNLSSLSMLFVLNFMCMVVNPHVHSFYGFRMVQF